MRGGSASRSGFRPWPRPGASLLLALSLLCWALRPSAQTSDAAGPSDLFAAVRAGDVPTIRAFLTKPGAAQARDKEGMTPLHYAAFQGKPAVIEVLLAGGCDPQASDSIGMTPLHASSFNGHAAAAALLLNAQAPRDAQDVFGMTPLHYATANGHPDVVVLLLSKGADRSLKDRKGRTAEDFARSSGKAELLAAFQTRPPSSEKAAPKPALVVTDENLARAPAPGYAQPTAPDPCCPPYASNPYSNSSVAYLERELARVAAQWRDIQSRLDEAEIQCNQARSEANSQAGFGQDGSYSREAELRNRQNAERICSEYYQLQSQAEYLSRSLDSIQDSLEEARARAAIP
ncbi:MAG: ankyrin repeat domain-containing protein [Acidobacteriota bacterium]